jgi:hypothetical protein
VETRVAYCSQYYTPNLGHSFTLGAKFADLELTHATDRKSLRAIFSLCERAEILSTDCRCCHSIVVMQMSTFMSCTNKILAARRRLLSSHGSRRQAGYVERGVLIRIVKTNFYFKGAGLYIVEESAEFALSRQPLDKFPYISTDGLARASKAASGIGIFKLVNCARRDLPHFPCCLI